MSWLAMTMGHIITTLRRFWIAYRIITRHYKETATPLGITHTSLEDSIVETLSASSHKIYVHWGAYESGKSRAATNAKLRLQEMGKLVVLLHGWNFIHESSAREWLSVSIIGVPEDRSQEQLSMFLPAKHQTVLIIDHTDTLLKKYSAKALVEALRELNIPTLTLFSSWERAVDMQKEECQLLAEPGLGRWNQLDLDRLYLSFPDGIREKAEPLKAELQKCALLAGSPGILHFETFKGTSPNMHRAKLIDREWKNGIRALNGEDMHGVIGRFPDKDLRFHWD